MIATVVCWKWKPEAGAKHEEKRRGFSAVHVNKLRAAIEKNTSTPHEFVCVTDDWTGLHSSIRVVNIDRHFSEFVELGGCYRRLRAFDHITGLALFGPRFISIDLDVVVTGNLDSILGCEDDFRIWYDKAKRRTPYCGSLWGMRAGTRQKVWDSFKARPHLSIELARRLRYTGTDQAHISAQLFPKEKVWNREDGVLNFNTQIRRHVRQVYRKSDGKVYNLTTDGSLPEGTRMVFFNGKYDPSQAILQRDYPWIGDLWNG